MAILIGVKWFDPSLYVPISQPALWWFFGQFDVKKDKVNFMEKLKYTGPSLKWHLGHFLWQFEKAI